jgi:antirestriction protein
MREQEPTENEHESEKPEEERRPKPRIYVASLADYNEGRLHGAWIDAAQTTSEIMDAVRAMLRDSPSPSAEEWAIHDYEGFGPLTIHEYEDFETVARVAAGIVEHGEAFAAYAEFIDCDADLLDGFEDAYMGEHESGAELAEELLEGSRIEEIVNQLPASLRGYVSVDFEAYFDDLVANGEVVAVPSRGGSLYVFRIP